MKKILSSLSVLIKIVFIIISLISIGLLEKVIPTNYLKVVILVFSVIFGLNIISLLCKIKFIKIISNIFNIIAIIFLIFISFYLLKTDDFISKLKGNGLTEVYYLATLNKKEYNNIEDLDNHKIGVYYNNNKTYQEALKSINETINTNIINYEDLNLLTKSLLNSEIEAILISESSKKMIEEEFELVHIQLNYIYDITTKTKLEEVAKDIDVVKNPFIMYISGIDTYGTIDTVSRSDVNILCVINPNTKKVLLLTIPRDYYVDIYSKNGKDKLTHAGVYGVDTSLRTIENLLNIDINYYLKVNFSTLINVVDEIGGINVYSPYTFNTYGVQFNEGYNYMNGEQALAFSRARKNFLAGDRTRGENQLRVIEAIIDKMVSSRDLITNYLNILNSLDSSFQTNLDSNRIYDLVKFQLFYMPKWNISKYSLNGYDSSDYTISSKDSKRYVMVPNVNTINTAKQKIKEIMSN